MVYKKEQKVFKRLLKNYFQNKYKVFSKEESSILKRAIPQKAISVILRSLDLILSYPSFQYG